MTLKTLKLKFNIYKINFIFYIKNLFKYKHGYAKNCPSKKCPVCNTPWPKLEKTPIQKYLDSIGYYDKYSDIFRDDGKILKMPKGMKGQEILDIAKSINISYTINNK